jgi:hypothetical protein
LKLKRDEPLSNVACNFNLRRYIELGNTATYDQEFCVDDVSVNA